MVLCQWSGVNSMLVRPTCNLKVLMRRFLRISFTHLMISFFWQGLGWFAIAKYVRVQVQFWLDDGWAVPLRLRRGLPKREMACHEEVVVCCGTCDELIEVLFAGDKRNEFDAVWKAPCVVCGVDFATQQIV